MNWNFFRSGSFGSGIVIGVGAALLLPVAGRVIAGLGRPLLKESMKGGLYLVDKGKVIVAETRETLEDLSAEARAELASSKKAAEAGKKAAAESAKKTS
jgi:hypothetical protein